MSITNTLLSSANPNANNSIKFGRNYVVTVQTQSNKFLTVTLPFTIEFDINRQTLSSTNTCQIRIYNLSSQTRGQLLFNSFAFGDYKTIQLQAGYGTNLATIFTGNITQAWSVREGVNFITQIECYDGGFSFVNNQTSLSFNAGTPLQTVIETIMISMQSQTGGPMFGACGIFPGVLSKAETYKGDPSQILHELTGGAFFIDNGKSYALKSSDYVQRPGPIYLVNADTGLLNTPLLEQSKMRFEMLFEPTLDVGSLVEVISLTYPTLTGTYTITSVKHRGTISSAVCGSVITTGEFFHNQTPTPVVGS